MRRIKDYLYHKIAKRNKNEIKKTNTRQNACPRKNDNKNSHAPSKNQWLMAKSPPPTGFSNKVITNKVITKR